MHDDGEVICGLNRDKHYEPPSKAPSDAPGEAVIVFAAYAEAVQALVRFKNRTYQDAWKRQGYMGNLGRILTKAARLEAMIWCDDTAYVEKDGEVTVAESVTDTLKDLMALCAFMGANIEDGNRWGR